jgi:hypothetical protein
MGKVMDEARVRRLLFLPHQSLLTGCGLLAFTTLSVSAFGQTPSSTTPDLTSTQQSAPPPSPEPKSVSVAQNATVCTGAFVLQTVGGEIKEDPLKQLLVGKTLFLRSGYQDNNLEFDPWGRLVGHSPQGSYTLSQIQINKVNLTKHKLELRGDRYALHFLGAAPFEDPMKATDRVKITPKKKVVRISFDRVEVDKPKKDKEKDKEKKKEKKKHSEEAAAKTSAAASRTAHANNAASTDRADDRPSSESNAGAAATADPVKAQPPAPRPGSDDKPKTTSPAVSSGMLLTALDKVFSRGIDEHMIAAMPDFWKLYYQAAEAKQDFKPAIEGVYRQNNVDEKAKLVSVLDPPSNAFAQANGVAGIALYHAVVGSDGKVGEIVAGRPIGFGLDENAEQAIQKAVFQPAMKDGKPVPVVVDLVVSFRIYSKLTSQPNQAASEKPDQPVLPGPYSVQANTQAPQQSPPPSQEPK